MHRPLWRVFLPACLWLALVLAPAAVPASPAPAPAEATHAFSIHDMLAMERISDARVSPDGKWIVFNLRVTDLEANRGRTDLWMVGADGKGLRRLTSHTAADFGARWAADGKCVYFLSTRSGSSQVWRLQVDGGEAEQVTDLPLDVGNLVVSPDGERLAVTMEVFPGETPLATAKKLEAIASGRPRAGSSTGSSSVTGTPGRTAAARTSSSCPRRAARPWT